MNKLLLAAATLLFMNSAFAALEYNCIHDGQTVSFTIDQHEKIINFHNVDYLGYAQILVDHDFPCELKKNSLTFEYDWYYTASYRLNFKQPLATHQHMRGVEMYLTFDDMDGSWDEDIKFQCEITNRN